MGSRVLDLGDQDITRTSLSQLVHSNSNLLPLHHNGDSDPAALLERSDGWRAVTRCDLLRDIELRALDVVLAEDVLLGGCIV